jgi:hypothetical protein
MMAGVAFGVSGCSIFRRSTVRYRMTLEIDTPAGLRSGSSILQSEYLDGPNTGQASGLNTRSRGEAAAVDLANGTLFTVLFNRKRGADYAANLPYEALRTGKVTPSLSRSYAGHKWFDWYEAGAELRRVKPRIELSMADYPMLVRFRDPQVPSSVEEVLPEDLATIFGAGVSLRSIWIQITDDPLSNQIVDRLPWLPEYKNIGLDRSRIQRGTNASQVLGGTSFSTEVE